MARRVKIVVTGRVQAVGFREATRQFAVGVGLGGVVRNLVTGDVEIIAEGEEPGLEKLLDWARHGPPSARVDRVEVEHSKATGEFTSFEVH